MGLIDELQADAVNNTVRVDHLLRKMKLATAKLRLGDLEHWVDQEINGYRSKVPEYRILYGQPAAWNPYNGWIPVQASGEWMELLSRAVIAQGIGGIADLIEQPTDGHLHLPMAPESVEIFNQVSNFQTAKLSVQLSRGHIVGILDRVRNMVLDWAIEMERRGVVGDGLSFSSAEQTNAKAAMTTINTYTIGNFAGILGNENKSGPINATQTVNEAAVFEALADVLQKGISDVQMRQMLLAAVQRMEQTRHSQTDFATAYGEFIAMAAAHMTIVAPFLPALASYLG